YTVNENLTWGILGGLLDGDSSTRGITKMTCSNTESVEDIWYENDPEISMFSIHFANETTGYIAGYKNGKGAIWKNDTGINTMGTKEVEKNKEVKDYPNAATNEINIAVENTNIYSVTLTEMSGRQIYSQSFDTKKIKIITEQFPKGTYILSVNTKE